MLAKKGWFDEISMPHSRNTDLMVSGFSVSLSLRMTLIAYCSFAPDSSPRNTLPNAPWQSKCVTKKSLSSASSRPSALFTSLDWFCGSKRTNGSRVENKLPCLFSAACCYGYLSRMSNSSGKAEDSVTKFSFTERRGGYACLISSIFCSSSSSILFMKDVFALILGSKLDFCTYRDRGE